MSPSHHHHFKANTYVKRNNCAVAKLVQSNAFQQRRASRQRSIDRGWENNTFRTSVNLTVAKQLWPTKCQQPITMKHHQQPSNHCRGQEASSPLWHVINRHFQCLDLSPPRELPTLCMEFCEAGFKKIKKIQVLNDFPQATSGDSSTSRLPREVLRRGRLVWKVFGMS